MTKMIDAHKTPGNVNDKLTIEAVDEPGPGGAHHEYRIYDATIRGDEWHIEFQKGGIDEHGINGITHEALIAIIIDRLTDFQAGPFECAENAAAIKHLEIALSQLKYRTTRRMTRGIEGQEVA